MMMAVLGALAGWVAAGERSEKAQDVRLLDLWVVGPLLIAFPSRAVVRFIGGATIGYNGRTYYQRLEETAVA